MIHRSTASARGKAASFAALMLGVVSCADAGEGAAPMSEVESAEEPLYFSNGTTLWNDNQLGVGTTINVCFTVRPRIDASGKTQCSKQTDRTKDCLGQTMPTDALRSLIVKHVENTWMRYANVELLNFGDCPIDAATNKHKDTALANTIAIQFSHEADPPANVSCTTNKQCTDVTPDGVDSGAFCNIPAGSATGICQAGPVDVTSILGKSASVATVIQYNWPALNNNTDLFNLVHEFGHALGFQHEWLRPDWTLNRCGSSPVAGTNLTPFPDPDSKMQYCTGSVVDVPTLSPGDIIGVQKAYGRKYDGSIVGYRGMCADVQGGSTADGTPVIAFPCRGQWNDEWGRSATSTFERFQSHGNGKCLNVSGGVAPNPVISWTCGDFENERFTTLGVEWHGMGNMCVAAVAGKLQVQTCNGSSAQAWDFFHPVGGLRNDQIRLSGTNSCVSSTSTSGALGEELVLATCSASDTKQRFSNPGSGRLSLSNNTGFCANVAGGLPTPGSKVVLWNGCTATPPYNSQFTLSGRIKSLNNCMQIVGAANPGDALRAQACDSSNTTTQIWEYYL